MSNVVDVVTTRICLTISQINNDAAAVQFDNSTCNDCTSPTRDLRFRQRLRLRPTAAFPAPWAS